MQVVPVQAGAGGLGGAVALALYRAFVTPPAAAPLVSPPAAQLAAEPLLSDSAVCSCSLFAAAVEWAHTNENFLVLSFVGGLLFLTLVLGVAVGVLVGSVAHCAIGRFRAPGQPLRGLERVAAHRG